MCVCAHMYTHGRKRKILTVYVLNTVGSLCKIIVTKLQLNIRHGLFFTISLVHHIHITFDV